MQTTTSTDFQDFDGKTVLVTGGGTGIGKGIAEYFLRRGAIVTIAGPDDGVLQAAAADLAAVTSTSGELRTTLCDVTEEAQVAAAVETAADQNLDILVANAGTGLPGPVELLEKAHYHYPFDVNVVGTALCIKHAAKIMKRHGGGAVVAISSIAAVQAGRYMGLYGATKAALDALIPIMAWELGPYGIRVNGIRPGMIVTDAITSNLPELIDPMERESFIGRNGEPEDVAKAVAFLASDQAAFITGQLLNVCGGQTCHTGADYEKLARTVFGDDAVDAL